MIDLVKGVLRAIFVGWFAVVFGGFAIIAGVVVYGFRILALLVISPILIVAILAKWAFDDDPGEVFAWCKKWITDEA